MKERILAFGGTLNKNKEKGRPWTYYSSGLALEILPEHSELTKKKEMYHTPDFIDAADAPSPFKAGAYQDGRFLVCTTTEVFECCAYTWKVLRYVTHPKMNDVHHALWTKNSTILVVSTGLDALLELDWSGNLVNKWGLCERAEAMLDDKIDYRNVECTKPHELHPNFVFFVGEDIYVTCFETAQAICVNNPNLEPFVVGDGFNIHDGLVNNHVVWFTATSGWIFKFDIETKELKESFNLNEIYTDGAPLGWCRGIEPIDEDLVYVGFSKMRQTSIAKNVRKLLSFVDSSQAPAKEARIALLDLREKTVKKEFSLGSGGMDAVFSLHEMYE